MNKKKKVTKKIARRRRQMACLILLIIIMTIMTIIKYTRSYRYADGKSYWRSNHISMEYGSPIVGKSCNTLTESIQQYTEVLKNEWKAKYPYMNWEKLETLTASYSKAIITSDGGYCSSYLKYDPFSNKLLISEETVNNPMTNIETYIVNGCIQCLLYNSKTDCIILYEGASEALTEEIFVNLGQHPPYSDTKKTYMNVNSKWVYQMFKSIYKQDTLLYLMCNDPELLTDIIDYYTDNKSEELFIVGSNLTYYNELKLSKWRAKMDKEKMVLILQDIFVHMANKRSKDLDEEKKKEILVECEDNLLISNKYFHKRLYSTK